MKKFRPTWLLIAACCLTAGARLVCAASAEGGAKAATLQKITIDSKHLGQEGVFLSGAEDFHQLVVTGHYNAGAPQDLSRAATYQAAPADVVKVDATGLVTPIRDGKATITITAPGVAPTTIAVSVKNVDTPAPIHFVNQVVPIFTKLGCNSGSCHGKTGGQNGFALSLFGFEPLEDFEHLVKEARGRRLLATAPDYSLLLRKASGAVAHAGGNRMPIDSPHYRLIRRWIVQGMPLTPADDPTVTRIEVLPRERILARAAQQQLSVIAHRADGSWLDVTRLARFEPNDAGMAEVSTTGLVTAKNRAGSVAVMVRYQTQADVFQALIPLGASVGQLPAAKNLVDQHVFKRLTALGMPPSPIADDTTFLRRATIDITGRLPTPDETKQFLADKTDDRHDRLVDRLLASSAYSEYFASKWSSVLRNRRKSDKEDGKATAAFHGWIKKALHDNLPYDRFVRGVVTVSGEHTENPPVIWYREVTMLTDQVEDIAQLYLGQRIACARCHHHPMEKWDQQDYWGLAAFLSRVEFKQPPPPKNAAKGKGPIPTPPMTVLHKAGPAQAKNPRTGLMVKPTELGGRSLELKADDDPRVSLVAWMAAKENPYFARALVNRYWKHFMGRGLVEPEDDLRTTNPATHPELLDALAKGFIDSGFDLKKLVRTITTSTTYRLSSEANGHNRDDRQSYSRFSARRLTAEVLLDAIDDVTLTRTPFKGVPAGTRAVQLPDNQADSYFLSVFGRPDNASACECERSSDANLSQSLHLLNSNELAGKIAKGRAAVMLKDKRSAAEKIGDLYLAAYSRPASTDEVRILTAYLERNKTATAVAYEDMIWAIVNSKEFMFNR